MRLTFSCPLRIPWVVVDDLMSVMCLEKVL